MDNNRVPALFVLREDGYGFQPASDDEIKKNGWERAEPPAVAMGHEIGSAIANRGAVELLRRVEGLDLGSNPPDAVLAVLIDVEDWLRSHGE